MGSAKPTNKVTAGVLAGAVMVVLVWATKTFAHTDVPAEVSVGLLTVVTFVVQYMVPDSAQDSPT